jgi:hypothetical protein
MRAPPLAASATCRAVASLCPTLTRTPASVSLVMAARAPSRSGASVTSRSTPRPASSRSSTAAGLGSVIQASLWAPLRAGEMNGPSACTPSTRAARCGRAGSSAAAARKALPSAPGGAVMNVGRKAVVPVSGSRVATVAQPSAPAAMSSTPK